MVSVSAILSHTQLSLESIVLVDGDASVRWVATSELADPSRFMEGGEILLTTGLIPRDDTGWRTLVAALRSAGVVALGFGVGLSHPDVPPALQMAARELNLNLFAVPRSVPFIAVSKAVVDLLWAEERDIDRQSLQYQRALTQAALRPFGRSAADTASSDGMLAIVETLASIVAGDIVLTTASGTVRAARVFAASELGATVEPGPAEALARRAAPLVRRLDAAISRGAATEISRELRLTVHPVGTDAHADLFLIVESESPASPAQRTAITMALALLTLENERSRVAREAGRGVRAGALALALRGDLVAAGALLDGAAQRASIPVGPLRVVRARGSDRELHRALSRIEAHADALELPLVARTASADQAGIPDQLVALMPPGAPILAALLELLVPLEIGVGPEQDAASIAHSDEGARSALALTSGARPVVHFSELSAKGVDALLDGGTVAAYALDLLEPLTSRGDAEELLASARAFLTQNGQVGPAAQSLGIHRNTLRGRLARIESALGRTLQDPQLRADLWVALKHLAR